MKKSIQIPISLETATDGEVLSYSLESPDAFAEIVGRYQRLFLRKAKEITGNEDDAHDIVQETFVRIYSAAKKFRHVQGASFRSWAYTILLNRCYTFYRVEKKRMSLVISLDPEYADVVPDVVEIQSREKMLSMEDMLGLVSQLPAKLKRMVEMHFIRGIGQKEIAAHENMSPVAVRVRIHRAKKELRRLHLLSQSA